MKHQSKKSSGCELPNPVHRIGRAFARNRSGWLVAAWMLALWLGICPGLNAAEASRVVVVISVDGLAGYYLDDPKAELPTLRALAAAGARSDRMKPSTPTVTWPTHTTLATGVNPARHGVLGNNYLDRATGNRVRLISDPVFDKDQIVKAPTIYDLAKAQGLKTAAIRWPASRNAKTLDWTIPDMATAQPMLQYTTPALIPTVLRACQMAGLTLESIESEKVVKSAEGVSLKVFNLILHEYRPNLALWHILEVDHIEHLYGPRSPEAYAAIKEADARVHEVWDELKRDYPDQATLIVVSDHGFSPIRRLLLPNVLLRQAGLVASPTNGPVRILVQGGSAMVYVLEDANRASLVARVKKALTGLDGISAIVESKKFKRYGFPTPTEDPHAPDLLLFAKEGCAFGDTADGDLPFNQKPERKGSHGHDPNQPDLQAVFVAWGAGIKPGVKLGRISSTSVAPTVATLLGFSIPNADGPPLNQALLTR